MKNKKANKNKQKSNSKKENYYRMELVSEETAMSAPVSVWGKTFWLY